MTRIVTESRPADTVVFRKRPVALTLYLVMGVAFVVQGLATALFLGSASDLDQPLRGVTVFVSLFLSAVGLWFAMAAWIRLRGPEDAIVIGPTGLHDRSISHEPIPWQAIRNIHIAKGARGSSVLAFDVDDDARHDILWWPRVSGPINRAFGYGYYVFVMGTEANVTRLAAAIARHSIVTEHGVAA